MAATSATQAPELADDDVEVDYYAVLELETSASEEDVRRRFGHGIAHGRGATYDMRQHGAACACTPAGRVRRGG